MNKYVLLTLLLVYGKYVDIYNCSQYASCYECHSHSYCVWAKDECLFIPVDVANSSLYNIDLEDYNNQ